MTPSQETLSLFSRFVSRNLGLRIPEERLGELKAKLALLAEETGQSLETFLHDLMSEPPTRERLAPLARTLTIGETYFLRDPKSYQVFEHEALPELIASRRGGDRTLRVWSAGCSTGEEPYSIAILLRRALPDLAQWHVTVLATDINQEALERARAGVYSQWSFRNTPEWLMGYFTRLKDGRYQISSELREMVHFEYLNLAQDGNLPPAPEPFDAVFCRNVLLYFEQTRMERALGLFHDSLSPGGWLFLAPTEVDQGAMAGFRCHYYDGAFAFRKEAQRSAAHTPAPAPVLPVTPVTAAAPAPERVRPPVSAPPEKEAAAARPAAADRVTAPDAAASPDLAAPSEADCYPEVLALYQAGRYREAAEAVQARPGQAAGAAALALAARSYANLGLLDQARTLCREALERDRLVARNHYLLAVIQEQMGEHGAAAQSLKQTLFIDADYLLAYFALGNLYRQAGDRRESERNFKNALRLLERRDPQELLEDAEGLTAGGLAQLIRTMTADRPN